MLLNANTKSVYLSVSEIMPYFVGRGKGIFVNTSSVAGGRVREPGLVWREYMDRITHLNMGYIGRMQK